MDNKNNKNNNSSSSNWQSVTLVSVCLRMCVIECVWANHNTQYNSTNYFHIVVVSIARNFQQFRKTFYTASAFTNTACLPAVVGVVSANTTPATPSHSFSLFSTHTHSLSAQPLALTALLACTYACLCVCVSLFGTHD